MPRLSLVTVIALLLVMIIATLHAFTSLLLDTWRVTGWRHCPFGPRQR